MTGAAWAMLGVTWSVIIFFTSRFFWMVLTKPLNQAEVDRTRDGILAKDA
jgi:hypothetical protein